MKLCYFICSMYILSVVRNTNCQFYDVFKEPDVNDVQGEFCQNSWRCEKDSSDFDEDIFPENCRCDDSCGIFGDCCHDIQKQFPSFYPVSSFQCLYLPSIESTFMINIITTCPKDTQTELRNLCETPDESDITQLTPVTGKTTGFLYRNFYCSLCHDENYSFWRSGIDCKWKHEYKGNYTTQDLLKQEECRIVFEKPAPSVTLRQCFPIIETCSTQNTENSDKCTNGSYAVVFTKERAFRNVYCAKCNDVTEMNLTCSVENTKILPKGKRYKYNYSYRLLFDLNSSYGKTVKKTRETIVNETKTDFKNICNISQIYDPFTGSCKSVHCIPPLVYRERKCLYSDTAVEINNSLTSESCPSRRFTESDFRIINGSKLLILSSQTIVEDFVLLNNSAYVCINQSLEKIGVVKTSVQWNSSLGETILTLVSQVLSILFLTIGLVIYITSSKLHNIPGKNLISLMASLFMAQLLFLIAPLFEVHYALCYTVATLVHWAFLSSFFWMNVMSFDVYYTFSKGFLKSGEKGSSSKRFRYYSGYGWSMSLLIVIISVCVDQLTVSEYAANYGKGVCWIASSKGLLIFFLIPISILLVGNLLFFTIAARNIYLSDKNTSRILKRKETCKLFIYLKLSVVMGLTWVFGFTATLTNETVLWYLFIIVNAMQGVFVFFAFVCTKKVRSLVRDNVSRMYSSTRSYYLTSKSRSSSSAKSTEDLFQSKVRPRNGESKV